MKLAVVLGTRPEVIKLAPVILEAKKKGHTVQVIFTGQHQHLALPLLDFFGIKYDLNLEVMTPNQTLTELSQRLLTRLDQEKSSILGADFILVQGDTTSAFVAGYWGFLNKIKVVHVEAGLRTYDLHAPFPEEANRQLIGRIASQHFAPTRAAAEALRKENVAAKQIHTVGNTGIDALLFAVKKIKQDQIPVAERVDSSILNYIEGHKLVLVTAHRRENFGTGFRTMCEGIRALADSSPDVRVVYPVHPNPQVREPVEKYLSRHERIMLCNPLPYVGFIQLMSKAAVLLTDSGGIQEEGPTLRKPIIVMRESTERPEGVKAGFAKLVGTDSKKILKETVKALKTGCRVKKKNPYGDGKTSARIISILKKS